MSKAKKYLYRKLPHFIKNSTGNDWQKCSEADKQKINTMFPGAYEFKKIEAKKPPKPTPNMLEGEPNQK